MAAGILGSLLFPQADDGARLPGPAEDFWYEALPTQWGGRVSPEMAQNLDAYFACIRVLATAVGILPHITYRMRDDGGKERARTDPRYQLLRYQPDGRTTAQNFQEMMILHCIRRGAFTARIERGRGGRIERLAPLHPDRVEPEVLPSERVVYNYQDEQGRKRTFSAGEVFRVLFLTEDGVTALSPLQAAARNVRLGIEAEHYAQTAFTNDPTSSIAVSVKSGFKTPEERDKFRDSLMRRSTGVNRHKPLVITGDADIKQLALNMEELQLLGVRTYALRAIARILGVPLHMIGDLERATFSNIEHQFIEFVVMGLDPWLTRIEQAVKLQLFALDDDLFTEFLVDKMLRGDTKSRYEAYNLGINGGWLTRNEARVKENMNPLDGLDSPLEPLNTRRAGDRRAQQIAARQVRRVVRQEVEAVAKLARKHATGGPEWQPALAQFYADHAQRVHHALALAPATAEAYAEHNRALVLEHGVAGLESRAEALERRLLNAIMEEDDDAEPQPAA